MNFCDSMTVAIVSFVAEIVSCCVGGKEMYTSGYSADMGGVTEPKPYFHPAVLSERKIFPENTGGNLMIGNCFCGLSETTCYS